MDINIILNILSIVVTIISIILGINQIGLRNYDFFIWAVVILEFLIIFLLQLQRKRLGLSIPKNKEIADSKLYKHFWKKEIIDKDMPNRKNLEKGFLHVFGDDVEKFQVFLIDFISKGQKNKIIYAVDLTTNPQVLLTRKEYHEKNKEFIDANNIIKRVLIIDEARLKDMSFVKDLYSVIMLNKNVGVQVRLITTNYLNKNQIRDFIIYDNSAAIIEGHQATENYTMGDSQIWFLSDMVESLKEIFDEIYKKADSNDQCNKFICCCTVSEGKVVDFQNSLFK